MLPLPLPMAHFNKGGGPEHRPQGRAVGTDPDPRLLGQLRRAAPQRHARGPFVADLGRGEGNAPGPHASLFAWNKCKCGMKMYDIGHKGVSYQAARPGIWSSMVKPHFRYLLVEGANARHRMDVLAFEEAVKKGHFKEHQVIVPGLIDTTAARVEDPRLIAETLLRYVRAAGHPARVMAGTDCGFASTAKSTAITSDLAWLKLRSLADGADLATRCFIEQRAPVPCRTPAFAPTPFRAVIFAAASDQVDYVAELRQAFDGLTMHSTLVFSADAFAELRWVVDVPLALVALGSEGLALAQRTLQQLEEDKAVARRPAKLMSFDDPRSMPSTAEVASAVRAEALGRTGFDKRSLVLPRLGSPPASVDVVVVGAGLLGMLTAHRCRSAGFSVAVLEQRALVGGIWSMYANATSQVNSSEGGYCIKELIGEDDGKAAWDNRDHSTAAEVLTDFAKLGDKLKDHIFTSVKVVKVLGERGNYTVLFEDAPLLV